MTDDPTAIRSLVVTSEDVVAAYEARRRSRRRPVLRVTPPFSGRMRARLHDPGPAAAGADPEADAGADPDADAGPNPDADPGPDLDHETGALHVPPARLIAESAVPTYPTPDDTEDALRRDSEVEFSVERHRERHVAAVESWRTAVREAIAASADLRLGEETHRVEVKTLGDSGE